VPQCSAVAKIPRFSLTLLVIGVAAISSAAVLIRETDAPPLVIASSRMIIASLVLFPFAITRLKNSLGTLAQRDIWLLLVAGCSMSLHFWLWITSLSYTSIASSVVLVTSHPVLVVMLSCIIWHERIRPASIVGIVVALGGLLVINLGSYNIDSTASWGNLMALGAAGAMVVYLLVGSHVRARIDAISYLSIVYTLAALMLTAGAFISGESFFAYSGKTYGMLALIGLVPQLIGHSSLNLALRRLPATVVSVAILGEPVGATLMGWAVMGEAPGLKEIAGGLIIVCGIGLVVGSGSKAWGKQK
jgi:drug/metabolite transporter (DMT)-like permease